MATARLTLGALLNTIGTAANTATGALDAASNSIGMLNSYVAKAAREQELRHKADLQSFAKGLVREKAREETEAHLEVEAFCGKSKAHEKHYEAAYNDFAALLLPEGKKPDLKVVSGD